MSDGQNTKAISRLTPASAGGRDALTYATVGVGVVAVLAIAWLGISFVRPLPPAPVASAGNIVTAPAPAEREREEAERQRTMDSLTGENIFAFGRGQWARASQLANKPEETMPDPAPASRAPTGSDPDRRVVNELGQVLSVVEKDDLDQALKNDLNTVKLRGMYGTPSGREYAMIMRVHLEPGRSTPFVVGDEFRFRKEPESEDTWRVEHIDMQRDRVALSRSGKTVWLRMRDRAMDMGKALAGRSSRTFVPGESVPVVANVTRAELRAQLIESGLSAGEVDEMLAMADEMDKPKPEKPTGFAAGLLNAVRQVETPKATTADAGDAPAPAESNSPGGIEALLKLMATGEQPSPEMLEQLRTPTEELAPAPAPAEQPK